MDKEKMEKIKEAAYLVVIVILLIIILVLIVVKANKKKEEVINEAPTQLSMVEPMEEEKQEEVPLKEYHVDIKGSVKKPGVYKVSEGTIINDVINMAGGLKSGGTTKNINLSKKVQDEMVLYIYTTTELKKKETTTVTECVSKTEYIDTCSNSSVIVTEGTTSNSTSSSTSNNTSNTSETSNGSSKVNINTADKDALMTLSGVGESKAVAIIEYRNKNGLFKSTEEIMNVSGIGEAAYQKIKDYITV